MRAKRRYGPLFRTVETLHWCTPVFRGSPFKNRSILDRPVGYSLHRPVLIEPVTGFIEEMLTRRSRGSCGRCGGRDGAVGQQQPACTQHSPASPASGRPSFTASSTGGLPSTTPTAATSGSPFTATSAPTSCGTCSPGLASPSRPRRSASHLRHRPRVRRARRPRTRAPQRRLRRVPDASEEGRAPALWPVSRARPHPPELPAAAAFCRRGLHVLRRRRARMRYAPAGSICTHPRPPRARSISICLGVSVRPAGRPVSVRF